MLAPFDYGARLDTRLLVRLRLRSTAVHVRNTGRGADAGVQTFYADGRVHAARSRHVVLANHNMMIPRILPELARVSAQLAAGSRHRLFTSTSRCNWRGSSAA